MTTLRSLAIKQSRCKFCDQGIEKLGDELFIMKSVTIAGMTRGFNFFCAPCLFGRALPEAVIEEPPVSVDPEPEPVEEVVAEQPKAKKTKKKKKAKKKNAKKSAGKKKED